MIKLANKIALASLLGAEEGMEKSAAVKMLSKLRPFGDFQMGNTFDPLRKLTAEMIDSYLKINKIPGSVIQPGTRNALAKGSGPYTASASSLADSVMGKLTAERISKMLVDNYGRYHKPSNLLKRDIVNALDDIVNRRLDQAIEKGTPEAWSRYNTASNTALALGKDINRFGA